MRKFKIKLPDSVDVDKSRLKIKRTLKTKKKYADVFVFLYLNQPCPTSEVKRAIESHYKIPIERVTVYQRLKYLENIGLVVCLPSGLAINGEGDINKKIIIKHKKFLSTIPKQFINKFKNVSYFYVSEYGEGFIPWATKSLGFEIEQNQER